MTRAPEPFPTAIITAKQFVAHSLHWLEVCAHRTQFRIAREGKPIAMLIPAPADPNRTAATQ